MTEPRLVKSDFSLDLRAGSLFLHGAVLRVAPLGLVSQVDVLVKDKTTGVA